MLVAVACRRLSEDKLAIHGQHMGLTPTIERLSAHATTAASEQATVGFLHVL